MLSIQSHVVRGYVGNRAATFPLQVRAPQAYVTRPGGPRICRAPPGPQPLRVTLARVPGRPGPRLECSVPGASLGGRLRGWGALGGPPVTDGAGGARLRKRPRSSCSAPANPSRSLLPGRPRSSLETRKCGAAPRHPAGDRRRRDRCLQGPLLGAPIVCPPSGSRWRGRRRSKLTDLGPCPQGWAPSCG